MKITNQQIEAIVTKYSARPGFRATPVRNFLGSLGESDSLRDARMNLSMDARAYKWKASIVAAITEGLKVSS